MEKIPPAPGPPQSLEQPQQEIVIPSNHAVMLGTWFEQLLRPVSEEIRADLAKIQQTLVNSGPSVEPITGALNGLVAIATNIKTAHDVILTPLPGLPGYDFKFRGERKNPNATSQLEQTTEPISLGPQTTQAFISALQHQPNGFLQIIISGADILALGAGVSPETNNILNRAESIALQIASLVGALGIHMSVDPEGKVTLNPIRKAPQTSPSMS